LDLQSDPMTTAFSRHLRLTAFRGALLLTVASAPAFGQAADTVRFTDIGNLRLAISNFGSLGTGFGGWPRIPSAEYPRNSGIEHLFIGGLWVGGIREVAGNRVTSVSTGAVDISAVRDAAAGFEFTVETTSRMRERSSDVESPVYSPSAVSQQDFLADFVDTNRTLPGSRGTQIPEHEYPLGLAVHMESYAWSYPFADNFVILRYTIRNVSSTRIDSVHVGLWTDPVVRNTQVVPPGGSAFFASGVSERGGSSVRAGAVEAPELSDGTLEVEELGRVCRAGRAGSRLRIHRLRQRSRRNMPHLAGATDDGPLGTT
jgi:hypothetical protein